MSGNAIERLLRYVPRESHKPHCGFFFADDGACDCGLSERRDDAATVEALLEAVKELLRDDDMPDHWDDCVCSYCVRYRALAAAVRRVETGQ